MDLSTAPVVEQFGRYRLHKKIGEGGMAEVFLASSLDQPATQPPLVIKRLHQRLESDREAVDLFLTEADVTMLLSHPNVIQVFDAGEANNRYYMCMEYVHGKDLEQLWERFRVKGLVMDPYVAAHIAAEILRGLDYVHNAKAQTGRELGLVHRDCTPSNVYVSSSGHIKLGDFGVAKLLGVERFTMAGSIKGKLGYLSPEQVAGEAPTQAIDLWAAAIILYEMASGARALTGDNELDIMLRIKGAKIPALRKMNKAAPKPLEKILDRALHKKQRKRYQSAREMLEQLAEFQTTGPRYDPAALVQYLTNALR